MLEESLYFVSSYSKWAEDDSFAIYSAELFAELPDDQKDTIPTMVRQQVLAKFKAQGIGRHSRDEIYAIGIKDVQAYAELLGEKPYLFGNKPTSYDASAFGVIGNIKDGPFGSPVQDEIRNSSRLANYIDAIRSKWFADI